MRDTDKSFWISYMDDIDFVGDGSGVGISAAGRLWTRNCRFSGWKTAILSFGYVWINTTDCTFEDNGIALHYNSTDVTASDSILPATCSPAMTPLSCWRMSPPT